MNDIEIFDDFLNEEDFEGLQTIFDYDVPWKFSEVVEDNVNCEQKYNHQYVHGVYFRKEPCSPYFDRTVPLLSKLNARALVRIKVNSICRTEKIVLHGFHTDITYPDDHPTGLDGVKTAILYLNTNNGFTLFENETKIESVANRCVTFPAHLRHSGTSCTDVSRRLTLNVVYF